MPLKNKNYKLHILSELNVKINNLDFFKQRNELSSKLSDLREIY